MLTGWETSMPATQKKTQTSSSIAKIESVLTEVLDGHLALPSPQLALQLAKIVRSLHKENRRLTTSNEQLTRLRSEALKDLLACQLQVQLLDRELQSRRSVTPLGYLVRHNPWDNSSVPRR
jgi:hypothetical protein